MATTTAKSWEARPAFSAGSSCLQNATAARRRAPGQLRVVYEVHRTGTVRRSSLPPCHQAAKQAMGWLHTCFHGRPLLSPQHHSQHGVKIVPPAGQAREGVKQGVG